MPSINVTPMDSNDLYRRRYYTDGKAGIIMEQTPVHIAEDDGEVITDPTRPVKYVGQCFLNGQLLECPIPAKSLAEAIAIFGKTFTAFINDIQSKMLQQQLMKPASGLLIDEGFKKRN